MNNKKIKELSGANMDIDLNNICTKHNEGNFKYF